MTGTATPPFGRLLTAMVTPLDAELGLDLDRAQKLARHLVDDLDHDGIVLNGTTGESPTTTDAEKARLIAAVREAVGPDVPLVCGVGTFSTAHTIELARAATQAGADGLLVVTPYYSKPPQRALAAHFSAVADASELPIMLYDIPHRSGTAIAEETLVALARHPRIVAVKDAKGDLASSSRVMTDTDLAYYSGDDALTLPLLSLGAVGVVGTATHFTGSLMKQLIEAALAGDRATSLALHRRAQRVHTGVFATQGPMLVKAALGARGLDVGGLRPPLTEATAEERETFLALLEDAGL